MTLSNAESRDYSSKTSEDIDNYDFNNSSSDSELNVFLKRKCHSAMLSKTTQANEKLNSIEIKVIKNIPTLLFFVFLLILTLFLLSYTHFFKVSNSINGNKYFTTLSNSSIANYTLKISIIISQILFLIISGYLFTMTNQRMSVPEHKTSKASNFCFGLFSILTILTASILCIYNQKTSSISEMIGISDNLFKCLYMIFSILTCFFSFVSLKAFEGTYNSSYISIKIPLIEWIMSIKRISIILMEISLVTYIISVILASIYSHHYNSNEKVFVSWLILTYSISSFAFLISFSFYVLTLSFDLFYFYSLLEIKPDIEYFFDDNEHFESNKNKLDGVL